MELTRIDIVDLHQEGLRSRVSNKLTAMVNLDHLWNLLKEHPDNSQLQEIFAEELKKAHDAARYITTLAEYVDKTVSRETLHGHLGELLKSWSAQKSPV